MLPTIDIVIVNWNSARQLEACLRSIASVNVDRVVLSRVVVIDNASTDGSADLPQICELPLTIQRNSRNVGFAAGCNQGAAGTKADYVLFLNPDTRLFADSLSAPLEFLERPENNRIGICGIQLVNNAGDVSPSCVRFITPGRLLAMIFGFCHFLPTVFPRQLMVEWDHLDSREVDQVMGAFFLVRTATFNALGGFDERFFVYCEEHDFAYRAHQDGWKSFYFAGSKAFHRGQGTIDGVFGTAYFYLLRSRFLYVCKHFGRLWGAVLLLATLTVEPVSRCALAVLDKSYQRPSQILQAYILLWKNLFQLKEAKPV